MSETNTKFKDTDSIKKLVSKYNTNSLLFSLGFFIIIIGIIPYFFMESKDWSRRIIPSLIIAIIGVILILIGNYRNNNIKDSIDGKYTVPAFEYVDLQRKANNKIFKKDLIIGILLIILIPFIYYLLMSKASFIDKSSQRYLYTVLLLIFGLALFIILYSKGKRDAYKIFK
ncbi:hypothetical protein [uncultured Anaerococcus sp.]|uniref:hypothetical protein n=1 Tax=uncultured Anaerococcus sp. TaxID=293428 RepID=UPI0026281BB7|nr:hypothetical protein [uncultured Anaerococcus sp.]